MDTNGTEGGAARRGGPGQVSMVTPIAQAGRSMSIAYVSPGWPPSASPNGVLTAIGTLAPLLEARGHRVTIVAASVIGGRDTEGSIYDISLAEGRRTMARRTRDWIGYRVAPQWTFRYVTERKLITALRRAEAERGIQIVEMEDAFGWSRCVCEQTSLLVTVRLHGPWFLNGTVLGIAQDAGYRARIRAEEKAIRAAHAITAPSRDVLERTRAFYGLTLPDAEVIPGTVLAVPPEERWRPEGCDPRAILFIGRFDRHKGGDLIIEAFGRVLRRFPDVRLWFVGVDRGFHDDAGRTWTIEEYCRKRIPGALEEGRIRWLGFQPQAEVDRLRRAALVTVVCSRYETFSSATLEAMAWGCPTVAARVGGIAEIIEDRVDGLLHRPEDPDDLADKIMTLLQEPGHAAELGHRAGSTFDRRFHPDVMADRWVDFYRRVIRRGKPR